MSWTSYRLSNREQLVTLFLIPTTNIYIYWSICWMETWTYYRNTVAGVWFNSFNLSDPSHSYSKCYTRLVNPWMYVLFYFSYSILSDIIKQNIPFQLVLTLHWSLKMFTLGQQLRPKDLSFTIIKSEHLRSWNQQLKLVIDYRDIKW